MSGDTVPCDCGHISVDHQSDPSGSGNTPCWHGGGENDLGYPVNRCPCEEFTPKLCDCGHDLFDHGGGSTPCEGYRNEDSHGNPIGLCTCRHYTPVVAHT